jgi:uracil-DNA glycosylase
MIMLMMSSGQIQIDKSWQDALGDYFGQENFKTLATKVRTDYLDKDKTVYPPPSDLFRAFKETPFNSVKVVILGQDPYHNPEQAHGLCFSVPSGTKAPPSLVNIFRELAADTGTKRTDTDLTDWAKQGVLLLNSTLTVLENQPTSHADIGWEDFTDHVIKTISDKQENVVFLLWGAYAQSKKSLIDTSKHLVLEAPHPSPLSAYRGFFGSRPFSKANNYLLKKSQTPINW